MTKSEASAALLAGAKSSGSEFITIRRDQLLLALSAEPKQDESSTDGNEPIPQADI